MGIEVVVVNYHASPSACLLGLARSLFGLASAGSTALPEPDDHLTTPCCSVLTCELGLNVSSVWATAQADWLHRDAFRFDCRGRAYIPRSRRVLLGSIRRMLVALQENRQERSCRLPSGVVSVRVRDVRLIRVLSNRVADPRLTSIGDWYPERNIFQILIAINSGTLI